MSRNHAIVIVTIMLITLIAMLVIPVPPDINEPMLRAGVMK